MDFISWLRKSYTALVILMKYLSCFKFTSPGVHTWPIHTDAVMKKAHQCLFFLRQLRKFSVSPKTLKSFYTCTVEHLLIGCIPAWYRNSTALYCTAMYMYNVIMLFIIVFIPYCV